MFGNADELFKFIKDEGVEYMDVRFTDLPGIQQQLTLPASTFDADMVSNGVAFDGSSVRGFQTIDQSDMVLFPDVRTAYLDPFKARKTIAMDFFVHDPITGEAYSRDPAQHRPQGGGVPRHHRHRRHRLLRTRGRVLHLRPGQLRHQRQQVVLRDHLGRGRLVDRRRHQRQPRLQGALQGRLLPRRADRQAGRPAQRHDDQSAGRRARPRARSPRGGHRPARPRSTTASTRC